MTLPLLRVDHSDAKERARYHRKVVVVQAPDQATVDEQFGGWGPIPNFAPGPPNPPSLAERTIVRFTVDRELSDGDRQCPAK
ncbi:MAG: hypothetical protein ACXW4C_01990 [Nitrospira sp.]